MARARRVDSPRTEASASADAPARPGRRPRGPAPGDRPRPAHGPRARRGRAEGSYLEPAPFASPVGIAVGPDDTIYVADSGRRRIFVYGPDGKRRGALGVVNGEPIFSRPTGIAVTGRGELVVADTVACRLVVLGLDGRVVRVIGRRGTNEGEFNFPTDVAVARDGRIYVLDSMNARVQVLDGDGGFLYSFGQRGNGTGDLDKPKGIALDSDGHVYVAEALHDVVQVFDGDGQLLLVIGGSGTRAGEFSLPARLHRRGGPPARRRRPQRPRPGVSIRVPARCPVEPCSVGTASPRSRPVSRRVCRAPGPGHRWQPGCGRWIAPRSIGVGKRCQPRLRRDAAVRVLPHAAQREPGTPAVEPRRERRHLHDVRQQLVPVGVGRRPVQHVRRDGAPQPSGSAKLCLSCHDGTVAVNATLNDGTIAYERRHVHTSHRQPRHRPLERPPGLVPSERRGRPGGRSGSRGRRPARDRHANLQCVTCHDPHSERLDPTVGKFLVKPNQGSAVCVTCHRPVGARMVVVLLAARDLDQVLHLRQHGRDPGLGAHTGYTTVTANGCESCHRSHGAPQAQRLLKAVNQASLCYQCHGTSAVAAKNIASVFTKTSRHPLESSTATIVHDATEVRASPTNFSGSRRHVDCADCHNTHGSLRRASRARQQPGDRRASGRRAGVEPASYPAVSRSRAAIPHVGRTNRLRRVARGRAR